MCNAISSMCATQLAQLARCRAHSWQHLLPLAVGNLRFLLACGSWSPVPNRQVPSSCEPFNNPSGWRISLRSSAHAWCFKQAGSELLRVYAKLVHVLSSCSISRESGIFRKTFSDRHVLFLHWASKLEPCSTLASWHHGAKEASTKEEAAESQEQGPAESAQAHQIQEEEGS